MLKNYFKNLHRDPVTTCIGCLLIVMGFVGLFKGTLSEAGVITLITLGIGVAGLNINKNDAPPAAMVLLIFGLMSCTRPPQINIETKVTDSTVVKYINHRDTVYSPADSVKIYIEAPCPKEPFKPYLFRKKNKQAGLTIKRDSTGKLEIDCRCDSLQIIVDNQTKEIEHFRKESLIQKPKAEHQTPWYDMAARWIAGIAIALIVLIIILKLKT